MQRQMHHDRSWEVPVEVYVCPGRRSAIAYPVENDSHGNYEGGGWRWGKSDYAGNSMSGGKRIAGKGMSTW